MIDSLKITWMGGFMRLPFDYVTFSVVGLSAISLSTVFLQFAYFPVNADAFYPLRMNLTDIGGKQAGSASYASQSGGMAEDLATLGNADAPLIETPEFGLPERKFETGAFAAEFGDGGQIGTDSRITRSLGNVLAVNYDLSSQAGTSDGLSVQSSGSLAGTIDVRKRIRVGKAVPTRIDVKVGSGTNIYVNAAQLSLLLETQGKALQATSGADLEGFVSLDDLRSHGFKVRYDAVGDALVVDGDV